MASGKTFGQAANSKHGKRMSDVFILLPFLSGLNFRTSKSVASAQNPEEHHRKFMVKNVFGENKMKFTCVQLDQHRRGRKFHGRESYL